MLISYMKVLRSDFVHYISKKIAKVNNIPILIILIQLVYVISIVP